MPVAEGWKVRYGVLDDSEAKQLQQLGEENRPLELAELTLNNRALKAVPSKKVVGPRANGRSRASGADRSKPIGATCLRAAGDPPRQCALPQSVQRRPAVAAAGVDDGRLLHVLEDLHDCDFEFSEANERM